LEGGKSCEATNERTKKAKKEKEDGATRLVWGRKEVIEKG